MKFSTTRTTLFSAALTLASTTCTAVNGCGMYGFLEWSNLPDDTMDAAEMLGYTKELWTAYQSNPIEYVAFDDLMSDIDSFDTPAGTFHKGGLTSDDIAHALAELDLFDEEFESPDVCWDFFVNHYDGYDWDDLSMSFNPFGDNLEGLATALGWTKDMWDAENFATGEVPASECMTWVQLRPMERWALRRFGWSAVECAEAPWDSRCRA